MVGKVPVAQVEYRFLDSSSMNVNLCGGQNSIGGIEYRCSNTDIQTLFVGTATEQTEDKDAHDACREDGIE